MRVGLRILKPGTVKWLRQELQRGELSRAALGRGLCEQDGWRNPRGELCAASARKALPGLAAQLRLELPAALPAARGRGAAGGDGVQRLEELGEVRLRLAETAAERHACARVLEAGHPLGRARAPGCRLTYLLEVARGPLEVLSFVAAPLRLGPRDERLGWDERTLGAQIQRVVCNDRFLVLGGVRVAHLASHVLGQAARRLAGDWERAHGIRAGAVGDMSGRPGARRSRRRDCSGRRVPQRHPRAVDG